MPAEFYSKWLIKTKEHLEALLDYDTEFAKGKAIKDRSLANHLLGGLYARYSMVVQELDSCLDQMIQVQKSFALRKITDAAVARLNELKEELTKLDISEYHYIDGALIELKFIPQSVEMIFPSLVYPRKEQYERFWTKLKNDETIYEPPEDGAELDDEGEEGARKREKKKRKVKLDPLAMLAGAAPPPEPVVEEEEEIPEEEEDEGEGPELGEARSSARWSRRSSTGNRREKKKRPCNRPKVASQLEAEMSAEEKAALRMRHKYSAAVMMIQAHERARQARLYVHDVLAARAGGATRPSAALAQSELAEEEAGDPRADAAVKIQTWWRGVLARMRNTHRELRRRLLIGMVRPSYRSTEEFVKFRKSLERGRVKRYDAIREYYQTLLDEKARVLKVVAPGLFEDIGDEIRQWFKDWYYSCKVFKDIPPAAEGGTVLVVRGDVESPDEHFQEMLKSDGNKAGAAAAKQKEADKQAADEKKKQEDEKKKKAAEKAKAKASGRRPAQYEFQPARTAAMDAIEAGVREYDERWADVNDADNPLSKPYMDVITEQMCYEVQMEVRPKVDELMRLELEILKGAVQKDKKKEKKGKGKKGGGGKKGKKDKKGKKGKRGKKEKGAGGKKGRKKKDPSGRRKVEDLFQELYRSGIIRKYPEVHISDYVCDFSYQNFEQRERLKDPPATLEDARQAVTMNCIVPIGVERMPRAKSVLLAGPRECGLEQLANAVFNDTQCVLFDLSPNNVYGKYAGKKGNKDLAHLVTKMAKLLEPSVIYVGDAEKAYYKKVPKEEKASDPKRVGKFLAKIVKAIGAEDRVLVLGTSYYPFLAQAAKLRKVFQKIILVPRSDYGSIYTFWETVLLGYHGVDRNFNVSALATMTRNYPLPQIRAAIERVLVPARIIQLHYRPLRALELIDALREGTGPVDDREWERYLKFYAGTKLGKARRQLNAEFAKIVENERKKEAVKGAKGAT